MIIGLIILLLALFVGIGLIMDDVLKDIKKMGESYYDIPKTYRDIKFNLFGIVFCSNLFGILSVVLLFLIQ